MKGLFSLRNINTCFSQCKIFYLQEKIQRYDWSKHLKKDYKITLNARKLAQSDVLHS